MRPQSDDTSPAAERAQVALLRQAGLAARAERMRSLSKTTFQLAVRALGRKHPNFTHDQLLVEFVALHHGVVLAHKLRADLRRRGRLSDD